MIIESCAVSLMLVGVVAQIRCCKRCRFPAQFESDSCPCSNTQVRRQNQVN